ncbi:MAG TPA: hypothetical protein VJV78_39025 [Polyangiales bacterium]|nr:hypothetical protein [Polyangiales bacterium]
MTLTKQAPYLHRRTFLALAAGSAGAMGCGYYAAERGVAYEPWTFPGAEARPERVVAHAALLACSPHNTQPWALRVTPAQIDVRAAPLRNVGLMDGLRRELHIGLGCAIENAAIAARSLGLAPSITLCPEPNDPDWVARIGFTRAAPQPDSLFDAIARRHTNRAAYSDEPLSTETAQYLAACAADQSVSLKLLISPADRERFAKATVDATREIVADTPMNEDGHRWYRHSHAEIERHRDGLTLDCTGLDGFTRTLAKILARPDAAEAGKYWIDATRERQAQAPAYGLLAASKANTREEQLNIGRAYQRIALWATSQGLALQPLNQLVERQDREQTGAAAVRFGTVLDDLLGTPLRAQMLFRIGRPTTQALRSPRRPLAWSMQAEDR